MKEVRKERQGLYRQEFEHDNCGIGAVVNIKGKKSHDTVANALRIVENLDHRAGKDAEGKTGDGVGILLQISHKFFKKACKKEGIELGQEREYGIGQFFFPQHEIKRAQAKKMFEIIVEKEGLEFLGWREVPVVPEVLGHKARECMPYIMQAFIKKPEDMEKGLVQDGFLVKAVTIGQDGYTLDDVLVHDAHTPSNFLHQQLAMMDGIELPLAIGVIRDVDAPAYDAEVSAQVAEVRAKKGFSALRDMILAGDTWTVE
jgi:hypothetical protein